MKVVHKLGFPMFRTEQTVALPYGARVVGFAFQDDVPTVWFERPVDSEGLAEHTWELQVVGTGHQYDPAFEYLAGPALVGAFVFHLVGRRT